MEVFIGMDYERGLKMLKEWIETGQLVTKTTIRGVESVGPLRVAGVRKTCSISEVGPSMEAAFAEATQKLAQHNLPTDGDVISVYHKFEVKAQTFDYTSGFAIPESVDSVPADLSDWSIPVDEGSSRGAPRELRTPGQRVERGESVCPLQEAQAEQLRRV